MDPSWLLPSFILGWLTICWFFSRLGGWNVLAEYYPQTSKVEGKAFRFASLDLGSGALPVNYRNCVTVRVNASGFSISASLPFRFCHPSLFIPWTEIADCKAERYWLRKCTVVHVLVTPTQLRFYGGAGREILAVQRGAKNEDVKT